MNGINWLVSAVLIALSVAVAQVIEFEASVPLVFRIAFGFMVVCGVLMFLLSFGIVVSLCSMIVDEIQSRVQKHLHMRKVAAGEREFLNARAKEAK